MNVILEVCVCGSMAIAELSAARHPYMRSTAGCWAAYSDFAARAGGGGAGHIDAYAAQHYLGTEVDPRQLRSVAVHLTALCLAVEFADPRVDRLRGRLSELVLPIAGLDGWPRLRPPAQVAGVNIDDVSPADMFDETQTVESWKRAVWEMWHNEHATIRPFARIARDHA